MRWNATPWRRLQLLQLERERDELQRRVADAEMRRSGVRRLTEDRRPAPKAANPPPREEEVWRHGPARHVAHRTSMPCEHWGWGKGKAHCFMSSVFERG